MGDFVRECGDCVACCVYLRINTETLVKRRCEHCPNLSLSSPVEPNVMQLSSEEPVKCSIYADRPNVCREYRCSWLDGHGEEQDRPDRSLILIDTIEKIENGLQCKPLSPDGENNPKVQATIRRMMASTGSAALVTDFYERKIVRVMT